MDHHREAEATYCQPRLQKEQSDCL